MNVRPLPLQAAPGIRLGDPLRRAFLDDLRGRAILPRPLAAEWGTAGADLVVTVQGTDEHDPVLVIAAGTLEGPRRWVMRQSLDDLRSGDVFDVRREELRAAGHEPHVADDLAERATEAVVVAVADALEHVGWMRPEQASAPRAVAAAIRDAVSSLSPADDGKGLSRADDGEGRVAAPRDEAEELEEDDDEILEVSKPEDSAAGEPEAAEERLKTPWSDEVRLGLHRPPQPSRPLPKRRRGRTFARAVVVLALVGGAVAAAASFGTPRRGDSPPGAAPPDTSAPEDTAPAAAPAPTPDYTVHLRNPDGSPVRFNPCQTHEYVVQPGSLTRELVAAEVGAGFAGLEEASGLAFRFAGFTIDRFPFPIDPGAPPPAPILVSYEAPNDSRALREGAPEYGDAGHPLGGLTAAGPVTVREGLTVLQGGAVVINASLEPEQRLRVLLHELGHLAGLGHAGDPDQIMASPVPQGGVMTYREGDRAGLGEVGAGGGCLG